jgi:ribonuclease VapC
MIFVDASALVAVSIREPEAGLFADILAREVEVLTSPLAIFEAALAIRREWNSTVEEAHKDVEDIVHVARISIVPITDADAAAALAAFAQYGKGRGHPAQLNMGDCFAYGMAKSRGAALLYKGNDFARTDIQPATDPV